MNKKIAGSIILYNPNLDEVINNIYSYLDYIDKLFIIDNTERNAEDKNFSNFFGSNIKSNKFYYVAFNENLGVGKALNLAIEKSIDDGYDYLLTLDQDSHFNYNSFTKLFRLVELKGKDDNILLYAPKNINNIKLNLAITSGNLVNVKAAATIGGYREDFFIDHIDHEFCLKGQKKGFRIELVDGFELIHSLGEIREIKFFFLKWYIQYHSLLRFYYYSRNGYLLIKEYPKFTLIYVEQVIKEYLKYIFSRESIKAIKIFAIAIKDAKKLNLGKCEKFT